jgi:hypothetical protein
VRDLNVRASDMPEGFFTEGNEENEGRIFSLKRISWLPFVSFCSTESAGALLMAPSTLASQSSALHDQAINCRSTLLSFFVVPVYPPWRVIRASSFVLR